MSPRALLFALALPALTLGCRFDGAPVPSSWPADFAKGELAGEPEREPLPFRVGLAPIRVGFDPSELYAGDPQRCALLPDTVGLRRELQAGLDALRLFERAEPRGNDKSTPERVAREAWDASDDLILSIELQDYHQVYLDHVNHVTWLVFYVGAVFPAYWVPVDRYGCEIEAKVTLRGVQGGPPLLEEVYKVKALESAQELRPLDREFVGLLDLYALWNTWNSLEESNWRAIERQVAPHAWRKLLLKIFRDMEKQVARPLRDVDQKEELLRQVRKRFALVVGVGRYEDPRIGNAPYAAEDAGRIRDLLTAPEGGELELERDVSVLTNGEATREAVIGGLDDLASRAAPSDEVVIYLAGNGASGIAPLGSSSIAAPDSESGGIADVTTARGVVLLADSQSAEAWTSGLTFEDLGSALDRIRAKRVLVVLDVGFGAAEDGGRTFALEASQEIGLAPNGIARALGIGAKPGRALLFAGRPQQTALALPGPKAGLLTYAFDLGLRGAADRDANGRVELGELWDYVGGEVRGRAGLEGFEQEPLLIGELPPMGWPR